MNVVATVKSYISKMIDESGPGMKVLLMDKQTTSIVSMVYSQSEVLQREVYLFERIDSGNQLEPMRHLKCIAFLRPTKENISLLCSELKYPRYGAYYIYLSNITSKADIKSLAESDEQEVVREIQEFYADYLAVSPHLFSLSISQVLKGLQWNQNYLQRCVHGITAVLLSLKKKPIIRFQKSSRVAERLAERINEMLSKESSLFVFHQADEPVLLILDRRGDAVTPLLNQWTYQAMVHELLTISNNRVTMPETAGCAQEMKEIVLSAEQDDFYAENLYKNFGEIGQEIKKLMEEFQKKAKSHQKVESIADMKNFVECYPAFKKMSGNALKHVNLVSELSHMIGRHSLLEVSEVEQDLATQDEHSNQLQNVKKLIADGKIRDIDAVRLVMLYSLRYEKHRNNDITGLIEALKKKGVAERYTLLIQRLLAYGGEDTKTTDSYVEGVEKIKKKFFALKGVENVFTRHTPLLKSILEDIMKGKIKENLYPALEGSSTDRSQTRKVQHVIVFIVGGATYEEALAVHQLNLQESGIKIVLGGTTIHNTTSFLDEMETATEDIPIRTSRMRHI